MFLENHIFHVFSQKKQRHSSAPFLKELFLPHSCWSDARCQEASGPTRIPLWHRQGQRGHLNISQSWAGSALHLKPRTSLIGLSLPTVLSFGLSLCQKKQESNVFIFNFHNLDPKACGQGWLFLNREFRSHAEPHWCFSVVELR